ncbi:contact-dependent growth inhibition system immunity protein [Streptomyces sp. NPDC002701]|uniref:contact-dependent growth inhibition system immunity protein n=1 Tax=Streptomyces sp. NPDC002701 TaxID=3364661 RepID=UPI0036A6B7BD
MGLAHLLPLAVEVRRINPLAEGDVYEGDLLAAVLTGVRRSGPSVPNLSGMSA